MGSLRDFRKISESKNHVSLADSIRWQYPMPAIRIDRNLIAPLKCTKCVASVDRTVVFRNNPKMFFSFTFLPLFAPFLIPSGTTALPLSPEWARYLRRYLWDQSFNTAHDKNGVENDMKWLRSRASVVWFCKDPFRFPFVSALSNDSGRNHKLFSSTSFAVTVVFHCYVSQHDF